MDTKCRLHIARNEAGAGGDPDMNSRRPVMLLCITLVILAVSAPLLVTLPQTLEAVASPAPSIAVPSASQSAEPAFHERYPTDATTAWTDSLEETELATWRMRSSD